MSRDIYLENGVYKMTEIANFYKGTLEDFMLWEIAAEQAEEIPNEYTNAYSEFINSPSVLGEGIWKFGKYDTLTLPKISYDDAVAQGYFGN